MKSLINYFSFIILSTIISGCNDLQSSGQLISANVANDNAIEISGGGIKGPLAYADIKIYKLDPGFPEFYDESEPIGLAITNELALFSGLLVPAGIRPPYVMKVSGDHVIDLNTGKKPVISSLITLITEDMLAENRPIYATPLTTLAFHMAVDGIGASLDIDLFTQLINESASQVVRDFSINTDVRFDIFRSPLIIDDKTVSTYEREEAVYHRASLEAFTDKIYKSSLLLSDVSTDYLIKQLAQDMQSDSVIDNSANDIIIGDIDPSIMLSNPMDMQIPNTGYQVKDVALLMHNERTLLGSENDYLFEPDAISLEYNVNPIDNGSGFAGIDFDNIACRNIVDGVCELDLNGVGSYQNPAWSPDGYHLLLTHFPSGYNSGAPKLVVFDLKTGSVTTVGSGVNLPGNSNTWNHSGKIVYSHEPENNENILYDDSGSFEVLGEQAYVSNVTGDITPSPITSYTDDAWEPAFSPENTWTHDNWVVFQDKYDKKILITEVYSDFNVRRNQAYIDITDFSFEAVKQPVWSPSGKHIIYQGKNFGDWELQLVDVPQNPAEMANNGSAYTRKLNVDGTDPSFSPDGNWIVYSGGGTVHDSLHIVSLPLNAGDSVGQKIKVTPRRGWYEGAPGWSPDGKLVAYEASEGSPDEIGRTSIWIAKVPQLP